MRCFDPAGARSVQILSNRNRDEAVEDRVRRRLRELRIARGMTLKSVAAKASIDISTLSRLESGDRRIALDHLPGLASALGVSTDDLLRPQARQDPRVRGRARTHEGLTMWPLTDHGPAGGLQAFKIRISPERRVAPTTLSVHEGHDWMYVLTGDMRLVLDDQELIIRPGEAVEFSTLTPHWFGATDAPVEVIAIFGPHGDRLHLRA
jgi:transcriptional regulator with XRE-family HTH domain